MKMKIVVGICLLVLTTCSFLCAMLDIPSFSFDSADDNHDLICGPEDSIELDDPVKIPVSYTYLIDVIREDVEKGFLRPPLHLLEQKAAIAAGFALRGNTSNVRDTILNFERSNLFSISSGKKQSAVATKEPTFDCFVDDQLTKYVTLFKEFTLDTFWRCSQNITDELQKRNQLQNSASVCHLLGNSANTLYWCTFGKSKILLVFKDGSSMRLSSVSHYSGVSCPGRRLLFYRRMPEVMPQQAPGEHCITAAHGKIDLAHEADFIILGSPGFWDLIDEKFIVYYIKDVRNRVTLTLTDKQKNAHAVRDWILDYIENYSKRPTHWLARKAHVTMQLIFL